MASKLKLVKIGINLAVMSVPLLAATPFLSAQWTNEPSGSSVLLDHNFNVILGPGMENPYKAGQVVSLNEPGMVSPGAAYKSSICAGCTGGGTQLHFFTPGRQVHNEMYVSVIWRTNPGFEGRVVGNKMFFIRGPDSNHVFNFNDGALQNGSGRMIWGHNSSGYDNSQACSYLYGATCYPNAGGPLLRVGVWTKLEAYVKKSTTKTSQDGIVRWWINGQLVGNYTNLNVAPAGINEWVWSETWDGSLRPTDVTTEWAHYLDHLHVSIPNCSAGGCSGAPPPPPPPPTTPPPPPPPPVATPGTVTNLAASQVGAASLTLSFTQVSDGNGAAAKYDVRFGPGASGWGALSSVSQGTCATPLQGTATSGTLTCTVTGLSPSTAYDFQLVAFSGVMHQGATYGGLSNVASATTAASAGSATDVNGDGSTNITDVQLGINQVLGITACSTADVNKDGTCNVSDVQLIVNKALGT